MKIGKYRRKGSGGSVGTCVRTCACMIRTGEQEDWGRLCFKQCKYEELMESQLHVTSR